MVAAASGFTGLEFTICARLDVLQSLELVPTDARTLHNRAQSYRALGRWKQAEADAKKAGELDPDGDGGMSQRLAVSALVLCSGAPPAEAHTVTCLSLCRLQFCSSGVEMLDF